MTVNLGGGLRGRWLEGGGETGHLLVGRGKGKSSQTEWRPAEPLGKGEEVGEGSSDADMGMGDASAMTRMSLGAEHHSQVVPPAAARALVQPGGLQGAGAETPRGFLQTHFHPAEGKHPL